MANRHVCGCKKHQSPQQCVARCRCACNADFVRVERWECRVGCGALLRKEDIADHNCQPPKAEGKAWDPACANCGELASRHEAKGFERLPPMCPNTPFELAHFRTALAMRAHEKEANG